MIDILLVILKILLIVIGSIIGLAVFLLVIVLFVPINYEANGYKNNTICFEGKVTWLFRALRIKFYYRDDINYSVNVLWKVIFSSEKDKEKESKRKNTQVKSQKSFKKTGHDLKTKDNGQLEQNYLVRQDIKSEITHDSKQEIKYKEEQDVKQDKAQENEKVKKIDIDKKLSSNNNKNVSSEKARRVKNTKKVKKSKISEKQKTLEQASEDVKGSQIKDIFKQIRIFFTEDTYKGVLKFVLKHFWQMIKAVLPRKVRLRLEFGTNDPAVTGYILGFLSIFYALTGNSMVIKPDFDNQILKGDFNIKGKVFMFILAYHGLRIVLDKRVKKIVAEYNQ